MQRSRRDLAVVLVTYAIAFVVGGGVLWGLRDAHPLLALGGADVAATLVVFGASVLARNASLYDPYWSVTPLALLAGIAWLEPQGDPTRQILVTIAVMPWALRLTWNWWRGWEGLSHEDWRYIMLRERSGALYPLVNLTGIHLFPTVLVFAGMVSAWAAMRIEAPLHPIELLGAAICVGAAIVQGVADNQLRAFRLARPPREAVIESGLWGWSRHPNYFGEVSFWWGLAALALLAGAPLWVLLGPALMTGLFFFISIPMIERRMVERRPAYRDTQARISMLVPLPPRAAGESAGAGR